MRNLKKMTRKLPAVFCSAVMTMALLAGCGSSEGSDESKYGSGATELNIMVWDGTWSEEVFTDFEEQTGIHVNVSYIDNTDTIISKLVQGSTDYDMIDIESAYVKSFVENDLLTELDYDKLDSTANIDSQYGGFVGDEDEVYTIPCIAPLYTTVVYNTETCPIEITSFKDLADPALEGQVCMVNSTISLFGMALETLGYSADSTDESQIAEAADLLMDIKANVKAFVGESAVSQLENNECSVAFCWDYSTLCNMSKDNWDKYAVAELDIGAEYSGTYWGIPKSSKHIDEAHQLMNFMLSPEEYAKSVTEWGTIPILTEDSVSDYLAEDFYENPAIETFKNLYDESWKIAVDDEQINIMDTYYTKLMSN